eukprot:UN06527
MANNITRYGCPVYKNESGMAYLFYCKYYSQNEWRVSQSLPDEGSRAPARIRSVAQQPTTPLDPHLFWEIVDLNDHWNSKQQGISVRWHFEDSFLDAAAFQIFTRLGLKEEDSSGWISNVRNINANSSIEKINVFRDYFSSKRFPTLISVPTKKAKKISYPSIISLNLADTSVPESVKVLMGTYNKTDKTCYDAPVYKQISGNSWLFFCKKYANHDWRVSPILPQEGEVAPARIRAYTKFVCSPLEQGLFWEAVNNENRWNTNCDAVDVDYEQEDINNEPALHSIFGMLGLPRETCTGWLCSQTHYKTVNTNRVFMSWLRLMEI